MSVSMLTSERTLDWAPALGPGIIHIVGGPGTGKTTLALLAAVEALRAGETVLYVDWLGQPVLESLDCLNRHVPAGVVSPSEMFENFLLVSTDDQRAGLEAAVRVASSHKVGLVVLDGMGFGKMDGWAEALVALERSGVTCLILQPTCTGIDRGLANPEVSSLWYGIRFARVQLRLNQTESRVEFTRTVGDTSTNGSFRLPDPFGRGA